MRDEIQGSFHGMNRQGDNEPNLSEMFDRYNRRFFGGKRPQCKIEFAELSPKVGGECDHEQNVIRLNCSLLWENRFLLRRLLLHEMCHLNTAVELPTHGLGFRRNLSRLVKKGEKWARVEHFQYRLMHGKGKRPNFIEKLLDREMRWREARKIIARKLGVSNRLLDRTWYKGGTEWRHLRAARKCQRFWMTPKAIRLRRN